MSVIASVEDAILTRLQASVLWTPSKRVRALDTIPAAMSDDELLARLRVSPALYLAFAGGRRIESSDSARIMSQWGLYAVSSNAGGEKQRRRGDTREIGAYEMLEIAVPLVHGLKVAGVGSLSLVEVSNLFAERLDKLGLSLYAAEFEIPLAFDPDVSALPNMGVFRTFDAEWDAENRRHNTSPLPAPGNKLDADDTVTLPQ